MEYKESPCIENPQRRLVFPTTIWLNKSKFEELVKKRDKIIYPHIDRGEGDRIYIGKSIPSRIDEGVRVTHDFSSGYYRNVRKPRTLEIVGTVFKNENGEWQLNISHGCTVYEIKKDFLVLSIEDQESFSWFTTSDDLIPNFALKGSIDEETREYLYIGKNNPNDCSLPNPKRFVFENYSSQNLDFDETVPTLFGKVHRTHKCLYVPLNNVELNYSKYDILCLKPSPSPLKILCRSLIRKLSKYSNEEIKDSYKSIPEPLMKFLKYPANLSVGEYMLKDEKIVREDGKFEMCILRNGELVIRSLLPNRKSLTKRELEEQESTQVCRIINNNVDSIWLHRFQIALFLTDRHVQIAHSFYEKSPEYRLSIEYNKEIPNVDVNEQEE
jgi:hypothetical protein